nr:MAG TPA: polyA polymerase [Caudoviricetes sp.]
MSEIFFEFLKIFREFDFTKNLIFDLRGLFSLV